MFKIVSNIKIVKLRLIKEIRLKGIKFLRDSHNQTALFSLPLNRKMLKLHLLLLTRLLL